MEKVKIKLEGGMMPTKGSEKAAAYDLYVPEYYEVRLGRQIVDLKFSMELPEGYKANFRPRSGFSAKGIQAEVHTIYKQWLTHKTETIVKDIRIDADVLLGLIDSDYRDHCGVLLKVNSLDYYAPKPFRFAKVVKNTILLPYRLRLAQMEICKDEGAELLEVEVLNMSSDRGGGFGHSGAK